MVERGSLENRPDGDEDTLGPLSLSEIGRRGQLGRLTSWVVERNTQSHSPWSTANATSSSSSSLGMRAASTNV